MQIAQLLVLRAVSEWAAASIVNVSTMASVEEMMVFVVANLDGLEANALKFVPKAISVIIV